MQIVINTTPTPYQDGKFTKLELAYSRDGKDATRKLARVGKSTEVFDVLRGAKKGESYDIELVKEGDYWNWIKANKVEGPAAVASSAGASRSTSTYETPDERKIKQLYICRQSSISNAINLLGAKAKPSEVLKVAQLFVDFVYSVDEPQQEGDNDGEAGDESFEA